MAAGAWSSRPVADSLILASSVFFSFEGLGLVLPVEQEMARPAAFPRVVVLASAALTVAFLTLSVTCGIAFRGELRTASVIAFLATRSSGAERYVLQVSNALVTVAVFLTYPLQLKPASDILAKCLSRDRVAQPAGPAAANPQEDGGVLESPEAPRAAVVVEEGSARGPVRALREVPVWALQRLVFVAVCVATTLAVGNIALLVSLFGAVGQTGLGMLAPLCHLALMGAGVIPRSPARAALDAAIVAFCLVIMVAGTYLALTDIIAEYRQTGSIA